MTNEITLTSTNGTITVPGIEWYDIVNTAYTHGWQADAEYIQYTGVMSGPDALSMAEALGYAPAAWWSFTTISRDALLEVLRGGDVAVGQ